MFLYPRAASTLVVKSGLEFLLAEKVTVRQRDAGCQVQRVKDYHFPLQKFVVGCPLQDTTVSKSLEYSRTTYLCQWRRETIQTRKSHCRCS
jgi:hypothetical protein